MNTKISIIIPVYNVAEYLPKCLDSCIHQTLYDIEIICVNDGSTDNSLEILQGYARHDNRLRIIDQPNSGVSAARNAGMAAAQGDWILFLDADDYFSYNACERIWNESLEAPNDIIVFGGEIFPRMGEIDPWYDWTLHPGYARYEEFKPRMLFENPAFKPFVWQRAYRGDFLRESGVVFDTNLKLGEDMVFLLNLQPHGEHFTVLPDILYHYRIDRKDSAMKVQFGDMEKRLAQHYTVARTTAAYWQSQGWLEEYGGDYLNWLLVFLVPDLRKADVPQTVGGQVRAMVEQYGLARFKHKLPLENRRLLGFLRKM